MKKQFKQNDALIIMKTLEKEAQPFIKKISDLTIQTKEDFELAGKLLKEVKNKAAQAKEREESLTRPLNKVIADIKILFQPFRKSVNILEEDTKAKMLQFVNKTEKQKEKIMVDLESGNIKKVETAIRKTNELEIKNSFAQIRNTWTAVCVDLKKTPREFLIPDEAKIKNSLKMGAPVPGWKWEQVSSIAV